MSVNLSPIGNGITFLDDTGQPLSGGLLYTYQAGSTTPLSTYTDYNGNVANANPIVLGSDGRLPSEMWLQAGFNYKLVLKDSNSNLIATWDNIYGIIGTVPPAPNSFTTGMIMLWAGAIGSIPSGWNLCDGTNGSPDLRDRFVIAAGGSYSVSQTGGTADTPIVAHTHSATSVVTDPGHNHTIPNLGSAQAGSDNGGAPVPANTGYSTGRSPNPTGTSTTSITVATTVASSGTSGTGTNIPPYYALCYIYKL